MSKRIMIVDDASAIRQLITLTLTNEKYEAVEAMDGKDALEKLKASKIDLIICDVNMPQMDGIEFLTALKNDNAYSSYKFTPVLMLTTESGQDIKTKGMELGAKAWLVKPFDPKQLIEAISKSIS